MLNLVKFAKLLVNYEVDVKNGDKVLIMGSSEAIPLIRETYREVLKAGGYPIKPSDTFSMQKAQMMCYLKPILWNCTQ
jgi:leucyl aminopeptidase (aminopeptidase T)